MALLRIPDYYPLPFYVLFFISGLIGLSKVNWVLQPNHDGICEGRVIPFFGFFVCCLLKGECFGY